MDQLGARVVVPIGAAFATTNFPPSSATTLIGATQMFGVAGGSAGPFLIGRLIGAGVPRITLFRAMGAVGTCSRCTYCCASSRVTMFLQKRTHASLIWSTPTSRIAQ